MGLLTIIRKNRQKEKEMRLLFLGLDNAGKTTILKKLNDEDIMSVSPTLGFNIKTFRHGEYALFSDIAQSTYVLSFTLNIWDVGGQRTLRPYWRNYFEQTDALVWVVDSGDRMRMQDCKHELHSLLLEDRLAGASLLVFANKQDLPGAMSDNEIREALDLPSIKSHHCKIWSCSAVTGENLVQGRIHATLALPVQVLIKMAPGLDWVVGDVAGRLYYSAIASAPQPVPAVV
ncbi:GTP-binding protein [Mycena indigotica]|uniref:ADP-ribosylation factor-like protein 2 n=1 Tax=Mycena indigotica TaxID=2126181 RepID=A0A8H6SKE7_9AGAR|nr:GTP-binding protein [Mycena indigotica]KAF7301243.1 GTP-binding protein [Mycena indigotica]